jgi:hypothetical protein
MPELLLRLPIVAELQLLTEVRSNRCRAGTDVQDGALRPIAVFEIDAAAGGWPQDSPYRW